MDNLVRDAMRMKALGYGVHYGSYKADHPHTSDTRADAAPVTTDFTRVCKNCGEVFPLDGRARSVKYCGEFCYRQANNRRAKERARQKAGITDDDLRVCPACGQEFRLNKRHASCRYCSEECRAEMRRMRQWGKRHENRSPL